MAWVPPGQAFDPLEPPELPEQLQELLSTVWRLEGAWAYEDYLDRKLRAEPDEADPVDGEQR